MKTHILYIILMAIILIIAISWYPDTSQAWLDGYRQQQLDSLPAPGVEHVKRPNPELQGKG